MRISLIRPIGLSVCLTALLTFVPLPFGDASHALASEAARTPELVVSATRVATPLDRIGSSVTVIGKDEIEKSHATQVIDLLRRVPGLHFSRNGGPGSNTDVRLRGTRSGQIKILIDGIEVNDASGVSNGFNFGSLQVIDIEQIEVLRGPQSALYGNDAMGGVINIITKCGGGARRYSVSVEGGSFGTHRESASVSGGWDRGDYAFNATHFSTDGFSRVAAGDEDDGTENTAVSGTLGLEVSDRLRFNLTGGWDRLDTEFDPLSTLDGPADQRQRMLRGALEAIYLAFDGRLENIVTLSASQMERQFDEPVGFFRFSTFDGDRYGAEYRGNYSVSDTDVLTVGGAREYESAATATVTQAGVFSVPVDDRLRTDSVFGQYQFSPLDGLHLTAGGRRDDNEKFGAETTYRGTLAYRVAATGTLVRGSYGTGAKAPTLFQLFDSTFGNPNLKVETSTGVDVGVEQAFWDGRATVNITAFQNDFEELLQFDFAASSFINVGEARTRGFESAVSVDVLPTLQFSANYTYLRAADRMAGLELIRSPKHSASFLADWEVSDDAQLELAVQYTGDQRDGFGGTEIVPTWVVVDLAGTYALSEEVSLFGRVENLLNRDYQEIVRFNTAGRSAYAGVRVRF